MEACSDPRTPLGAIPLVEWYGGHATFVPGEADGLPEPWAVVVFAMVGDRFLLAQVPRGWCTPSGHVEAGETPAEAAARETYEETGATLAGAVRLGSFVTLGTDGSERQAVVYGAAVAALGTIPVGSESRDASLFALDEIPRVYWRWDPLMEAMFRYAGLHVCRERKGDGVG